MFVVRRQPPAAVVITAAKKEDVRGSNIKSETSVRSRVTGLDICCFILQMISSCVMCDSSAPSLLSFVSPVQSLAQSLVDLSVSVPMSSFFPYTFLCLSFVFGSHIGHQHIEARCMWVQFGTVTLDFLQGCFPKPERPCQSATVRWRSGWCVESLESWDADKRPIKLLRYEDALMSQANFNQWDQQRCIQLASAKDTKSFKCCSLQFFQWHRLNLWYNWLYSSYTNLFRGSSKEAGWFF